MCRPASVSVCAEQCPKPHIQLIPWQFNYFRTCENGQLLAVALKVLVACTKILTFVYVNNIWLESFRNTINLVTTRFI
jgi:hypothetical protein